MNYGRKVVLAGASLRASSPFFSSQLTLWHISELLALFALMPVLSQSFFTLMRSHFVSFFLFSAWHICWFLKLFFIFSRFS